MNNFDKFGKIRKNADRRSDMISNVSVVSGENGFRCLHILWMYPDVMNIHGGRGDVMGLMHVANIMGLPVEIRRWDNLRQDVDWEWPHMIFMSAGELKCAGDVITALKRQMGESGKDNQRGYGLAGFVARGGFFIANGSSGAVLADSVEMYSDTGSDERKIINGLGLLHMKWKQRESVWGDDIWVKTEDGYDVIGNQIQVADVELEDGQHPFGTLVYGRGNNGIDESNLGNGVSRMAGAGSGLEGARTGNVIYTSVLGPLLTKNPLFTASILKEAALLAGIETDSKLNSDDIEMELKSAEYIKAFMLNKQK